MVVHVVPVVLICRRSPLLAFVFRKPWAFVFVSKLQANAFAASSPVKVGMFAIEGVGRTAYSPVELPRVTV